MQCIISKTNKSFDVCHRVCALNLKAQVPIDFKLLDPRNPPCMKEKDKIHYKLRSKTKIWVGFVGGFCHIFKCFPFLHLFCPFLQPRKWKQDVLHKVYYTLRCMQEKS